MKIKNLTSVIPSMITIFDSDGEVDENALIDLIKFLIKHFHGIYMWDIWLSTIDEA